MDINTFPPDTDEKKEKLGAFFSTKADVSATVAAASEVLTALKEKYPTVEKWGVLG